MKVAENANGSQGQETPSREMVREWIRKDLFAANYAIRLMLRYPDILDKMSDEIYERLLIEEQDAKAKPVE